MASTINDSLTTDSRAAVSSHCQSGAALVGDKTVNETETGSGLTQLRGLIAEGERSGRAGDWALYDFLDRMTEKRKNGDK